MNPTHSGLRLTRPLRSILSAASFMAPFVAATATLNFSLTIADNAGALGHGEIVIGATSAHAAPKTISVTSVSPADNSIAAPIGAPITVAFSAPVDITSVTATTIALTVPGNGASIAGTYEIDASGAIITFRPDGDLIPNLDYRLTISGVRGAAGERQSATVSADFTTQAVDWDAAAYVLFSTGEVPASNSRALTSAGAPDVEGVALRFFWGQFEDDFGNYDFTDLDESLRVVAAAGKKASIAVFFSNADRAPLPALGEPASVFYSIDENPNHTTTFGLCVSQPSPFDLNYRTRFFAMIRALGAHLQADSSLNDVVSYVNGAGDFSTQNWAYGSNLMEVYGDPACEQRATWTELGFTADAMIEVLEESVAVFMGAFPDKPQWFSVGTLNFGTPLSCGDSSCIATTVADWGVARYPDRFGVWREDISANRDAPAAGAIWNYIAQYRPRVGAQMVFSTADCPGDGVKSTCRLALVGVEPADALTGAIEDGSSNDPVEGHGYYLMPYQEIYNSDVADDALAPVFADAATRILWRADATAPATPGGLAGSSTETDSVSLSWTASSDLWDKENSYTDGLAPAASRKSQMSVVYRIWRNGALVGTSDTTGFAETGVTATNPRYAVSAVDAAGNESARTAELKVGVK